MRKSQEYNDNYSESKNGINLDYDWNTEYGDGDIPDIDKPRSAVNEEDDDDDDDDDDEEDEYEFE